MNSDLFQLHQKRYITFIEMLSSNVQLSSIEAAQRMLLAGDTTVEGLVRQYLDAIERINPKINAVLAINEKAAEDARKLDVSVDLHQSRVVAIQSTCSHYRLYRLFQSTREAHCSAHRFSSKTKLRRKVS